MQASKLRITTAASISALVVAMVALTIAPVSAFGGPQPMPPMHSSDDTFKANSYVKTEVESENKADVDTNTNQTATSGDVKIIHNDDYEGGAGTGGAANTASTSTSVTASNEPVELPNAPVMDLSEVANLEEWDDVSLKSVVKTEVESENKVYIDNNTNQTATSGSVEVICNDDVTGDATTGDATNTSSTSTTISLSN